jgi:hypothetical protein
MSSSFRRFAAACSTVALSFAPSLVAAQRAVPRVTVDGQPVVLTPPPIVRAGRLFVPLRGVFEKLGATVVYQNPQINATAGTRTVSLAIGSTQALVGGAPQQLDVAPFIVGASTYVPLRFVSQALGASVDYDGANDIVAIVTTAPQRVVVTPIPRPAVVQPRMYSGEVLRAEEPHDGAVVASTRPTISGDFTHPADPNSVRVHLDDLDVTDEATRSPSGFIFAPDSPLQNQPHDVVVEGRFADGERFRSAWHFTSGTQVPQNFVRLDRLRDGDAVGGDFTLSGRTAPNARVRIVAGARAEPAGPYAFGTGTYTGDTIADGAGYFSEHVTLQALPGGSIGLTVVSTDPATRESARARLNLRAE